MSSKKGSSLLFAEINRSASITKDLGPDKEHIEVWEHDAKDLGEEGEETSKTAPVH